MTLLSEMQAKLPVGSVVELSTGGVSRGAFVVKAVSSPPGDEDTRVMVFYHPSRAPDAERMLIFLRDDPFSATIPRTKIARVLPAETTSE